MAPKFKKDRKPPPPSPLELTFELTPKQGEAFATTATEVLYGGAAGSGKSHLARVLAINYALEVPGISIFIFRRLYSDLYNNHVIGPTGFRAMLAPWINNTHPSSPLIGGRLVDAVDGEIRFWNGSKIFLCHLQHQKDLTKYYGPEFHVLFLEEATQFSEYMIRFLRSRLRIPTALKIPDKYKKPQSEWRDPNTPDYYLPRAYYTSNPGGVGHVYIKKGFVDAAPPGTLHVAPDTDGGHTRIYIPARVDDNPYVNREEVKANLAGLPPNLVDALMNGNWNAVIGAFFPEVDPAAHIVQPFPFPDHFPRIMSMDWGAAGEGDPFSCLWGCVSDGTLAHYPRGTIFIYRRWSGHGLPKVTASQVAEGIKERERFDGKILARVAGGDIMEKRGHGESIFEIFSANGVHFTRADNRRESGANQVRERLVGNSGVPAIYWFPEASGMLGLLGNLQHDPNNPADVAPGDDHDYDALRYMLMSRPWVKDAPPQAMPLQKLYRPQTITEAFEDYERQHYGRARL